MTSTPSATAWSMAATRSAVEQALPLSSDQHALYTARRARGAMPDTRPHSAPSTEARTSPLPAATAATWVPWPSESRAERNSPPANPFPVPPWRAAPNARAVTSLPPQPKPASSGLKSPAPNSHPLGVKPAGRPRNSAGSKLGCSGQIPVSITPMTTSSPV